MASVVVVGGGIAGLTCAWRLRRAGHDVEVLESGDVPGGRMRSEWHGEYLVDRGAQFVASGYRNLRAVAGAVGLGDAFRPLRETRNAVLRDGRLEPGDWDDVVDFLRSGLLPLGSKLRLARLLFEVGRRWRRLDPLRPETAADDDDRDLASWLGDVVGPEARDAVIGPALSATFDTDLEDLSAGFGLLVFRFVMGGFALRSIDGGLGRLPAALAERVPVRLGCQALAVETETDGARVRYRAGGRERRVVADAAVVAVPGCDVAALCPKLTPAERGFFEHVEYVRGIITHLLLDRAPGSIPGYGVAFPRDEGLRLYGLAVDHHKTGVAPPGAGLLNAALTRRDAARMWDAPDDAVRDLVLDDLARTPIGRLTPHTTVVHRWRAMLPVFGPGSLWRLAAFLDRADRSPRLAFAGDYLIGPYTEAALTSGMRAADELVTSLG